MQQYLITTDEVSALSRGMSVHLDPDKIETTSVSRRISTSNQRWETNCSLT